MNTTTITAAVDGAPSSTAATPTEYIAQWPVLHDVPDWEDDNVWKGSSVEERRGRMRSKRAAQADLVGLLRDARLTQVGGTEWTCIVPTAELVRARWPEHAERPELVRRVLVARVPVVWAGTRRTGS